MIGSGMVAEKSIACRLSGDQPQDALDVGQEAEVEHLVGLVEHQHRQAAELQVALLGQVEQPARGADHDVGAGAQRLDLRLVGASAVDRHDGELAALVGGQVLRGVREVAVDLQAQLAGRHHDEGARGTRQRPFGVAGDAVQQRHAERVGLAHAGAGLTDEVVAGQRQRQRQFLDGEGVFDAFLGERADDLVADAEHGECLVKWRSCGAVQPFNSEFDVRSMVRST